MNQLPSAPAADSAGLGAALGLAGRLRRAWKIGWRAAGRGVVEFYNSENLTFAASIAYYSLLSFFPFVFLIFALLSRIVVSQGGQSAIELIQRALPSNFDFLTNQMKELAIAPVELGVASTLLMLWSSMGVFGAVTSAVNHAWGVEKPLGYFKHKLVSFIMLLAAGVLLSIALLIIGAAQVVQSNWFSEILYRVPGLQVFSGFLYRHLQTPAFILIAGLIYYFAPNAQVRLRDVWFGAILGGLLWSLAFEGFAWYLRGTRLSVAGQVGAVISFLVWVYLSAVILLYGCEVTAAYARLRKHLPQQAPAAPAREV